MKRKPDGLIAAALLVAGLFAGGCGEWFPEPPKRRPPVLGVEESAARLIDGVDRAIEMKSFGLPTRVKALIRHLRDLEINWDASSAEVFKTPTEAAEYRDKVVAELDAWFEKSHEREVSDSDEDRAELKLIIEKVMRLLRNINRPTPPEEGEPPNETVD